MMEISLKCIQENYLPNEWSNFSYFTKFPMLSRLFNTEQHSLVYMTSCYDQLYRSLGPCIGRCLAREIPLWEGSLNNGYRFKNSAKESCL